jgi:hypothetical protein
MKPAGRREPEAGHSTGGRPRSEIASGSWTQSALTETYDSEAKIRHNMTDFWDLVSALQAYEAEIHIRTAVQTFGSWMDLRQSGFPPRRT